MVLTPEREAEIRAQIADANKAYHNLLTGTMARVLVDQNGERVEFTATNRDNLYRYIQQLNAMLPSACAPVTVLGPARFIF